MVKVGCHFVEEVGAGIDAVDGVYPEHFVAGTLRAHIEWRGMVVAALEVCGGYHFGEVMCAACLLAGDVGASMLPDDGLSVDGYEGVGLEVVELCVSRDEHVFPWVVGEICL